MAQSASFKISKMSIQRFKAIRDATFHFDPELNVLTGPNNSGKTTVLEAISLWSECFRLVLKQARRAVTDRHIERGHWFLDRETVDFNRIASVRSPGKDDLFYNLEAGQSSTIELSAELTGDGVSVEIPLTLRAARGSMYEVVFDKGLSESVNPFMNRWFTAFPEPVNIIFASPVAALQPLEEYATEPKIRRALRSRASISVIRNRLYRLSRDVSRYEQLLDDVSYILVGHGEELEVRMVTDVNQDVEVRFEARIGAQDVFKDISLLGSGTIQLLELLMSLYERQGDVNVVLLDEPDSHIHRDIQRRLMERLKGHATDRAQVFMTTHNESLIRSAEPRHVFHLHGVSRPRRVFKPVLRGELPQRKRGLQPSPTLNILESLGHESALDLLNALEADHFFLTEGKSDAVALDALMKQRQIGARPTTMCWCFDGIENALIGLKTYRQIFDEIRNSQSLWDKAIVVLDRDYLTPEQGDALANALGRTKGVNARVHVWPAHSIEGTMLSEGASPQLVELLVGFFGALDGQTAPPRRRVREALVEEIDALTDRLIARLDDEGFQDRVIGQLTQRRRLLAAVYGDRSAVVKVFPKEAKLWVTFKRKYADRIEAGEVHHLATKDDVAQVVFDVARSLDPADAMGLGDSAKAFMEGMPWFESIISRVSRSAWLPIWDGLLERVGQRSATARRRRGPPRKRS